MRRLNSALSMFLVLCLMLTLPSTVAAAYGINASVNNSNAGGQSITHLIWDGTIATTYAGGDGTMSNPFQISSPHQLAKLANDSVNGFYYILTSDIYLNNISDQDWMDGSDVMSWTSISDFTGTFDGCGHSIYGLYGGSLFGNATGMIKNICIKESYVNSGYKTYVGAVAGRAKDIIGCSNSGSVSFYESSTSTAYVGGIAGYAQNISQCSNSGNVWAGGKYNAAAGGIVGYGGITVTNCYNIGRVSSSSDYSSSGYNYSGGIVGSTDYSGTEINCCYDVGITSSGLNYYNGGIVGLTINSAAPKLTSCYSSFSLVGKSANSRTYGSYTSSSCDVLDKSAMKQASSFAGFDFDSVWTIVADMNDGYPKLRWEKNSSPTIPEAPEEIHEVKVLSDYDTTSNTAHFYDDNSTYGFSSSFSESTDITNMIEKYVQVVYSSETGHIGYIISSISEVNSAIGTIADRSFSYSEDDNLAYLTSITIDETQYSLEPNSLLYISGIHDAGSLVLYHYDEHNIILGISALEAHEGTFQAWNGTTGIVTISGTDYPTNEATDISFLASLDVHIGEPVVFYTDSKTNNSYRPVFKINYIDVEEPPIDEEKSPTIYYHDRDENEGCVELSKKFEDIVFRTSSTTYNPDLAYALSALSRAAYQREDIEKSLVSLGFKNINLSPQYYNYDKYAGYSLSKKDLDDGSTLILIAVRGTTGPFMLSPEWVLTDMDLGFNTITQNGFHQGFAKSTANLMDGLQEYLKTIDTAKITYIVTGHSLGAAVANLTSFSLMNSGVSPERIYDYNFACPDVVSSHDWYNEEDYPCIFNIAYARDPISVVPGVLGDVVLKPGIGMISGTWGKYGHSRWFSFDWNRTEEMTFDPEKHDLSYYMNYLKNRDRSNYFNFKTSTQLFASRLISKFKILSICCPVDVIVYDCNGTQVASVINGVPNYHDSVFGDVLIAVADNEKYIALPDNQEYEIRLIGTDIGEMKYEVFDADAASHEVQLIKNYESVDLTPGKEMTSTVSSKIVAEDIHLFVQDESGMEISEVLEDGTEVEIERTISASGTWGDNLIWTLFNDGLLKIIGSGDMESFPYNSSEAWRANKESINRVVVTAGITSISSHAFSSCSNITNVVLPDSITSIGYYSFYNCDKLNGVVIPPSVTYIGEYAFCGCDALTDVVIPEGVENIDKYAFYACVNLKCVTVAASVRNIGGGCFDACHSLTEISINPSNSFYCDINGVFFDKAAKELIRYPNGKSGEYIIPESVVSIANRAFEDCDRLTKVIVPNTVTNIGDWAFHGCSYLVCVEISENLTNLGIQAFSDCPLSEIKLPQKLETISNECFYMCTRLTNITIPQNILSIGAAAFGWCNNLTNIYYTGTEEQWKIIAVGPSNDSLLTATIQYQMVSPDNAWGSLTWSLDDDGVLRISGNGKMQSFIADMPEAWHLYRNNIRSVIIEEGVTNVGVCAFKDCKNLTNALIPRSVTSIDLSSFTNCTSLCNLTIPSRVRSISVGAFNGCISLTDFYVDEDNPSFSALDGVLFNKEANNLLKCPCRKTGDYAVPAGVTRIGDSAFNLCTNISSITIPDSVTSIGAGAFAGCTSLKSVTIPNSITTIYYFTFSGCDALSDVYYGGILEQWRAIRIDTNNTALENAAIHYVTSDFIFPANITAIDSEAFAGGAFIYVKLPDRAVSIGWHAFVDCPNLAYIYIPALTTQIDEEAFGNMQGLTILGKTGTTAETYAQNHNYTFIAVP